MSLPSLSARVARLSCLLVSAIVFLVSLPTPASASGYTLTQQTHPNQLPSTYQGTMTRQYAMGPFASRNDVVTTGDTVYASWWQAALTFPNLPQVTPVKQFTFPFFGVNYTAITVTSKGFIYMGSYPYASDLVNLDTAQYAPDYSATGSGFPLIGGVARPVISFLHSAGGAVSLTSLSNSGTPAGCLSGLGACQFNNYLYEIMPPITSYVSVTTVGGNKVPTNVVATPINSIGTPADGYRFVLLGLQLRDVTGVAASVIVILYQSGLIEIYYYTITTDGVQAQDDYTGSGTSPTDGNGWVSVGICDGQSQWYSLPGTSQTSYSQLQSLLPGTALSFKPK